MTIGAFRCGLGSQVLVIKLVPHACGVFDESRIDEGIVGDDEVVIRACDAMEEEGVVEFEVTGFGLGEWPVDVGYDLATVVTDLSVAYAHVSAGGGVGGRVRGDEGRTERSPGRDPQQFGHLV